MAETHTTNKDLIRRTNEGLNRQSREAFVEHHADDVVLHVAGEDIHGIDAALEHEQALWHAFPDLHHTLANVIAEGDLVAYHFTAAGTHKQEFRGIEPTGREFEITGQGMVRVDDGAAAEVWLNYDVLGMLGQLGVVESPPMKH